MLVSRFAGDGQTAKSALFFPGMVEDPNYLTSTSGYSPNDRGLAVAAVPGGAVVSGVLNADNDHIGEESWVLKLNDQLGIEWLVSVDGPGNETFTGLALADHGIFATGVSDSLLPLGSGSDNKNSLFLAKLPFEGKPGTMRSDASLEVRYREPALAGEPIAEASYGLITGITYVPARLDITDLGAIDDLLVSADELCVTRLTPQSGADTPDSVTCAPAIPADDLIPVTPAGNGNDGNTSDNSSESGGGGTTYLLLPLLAALLVRLRLRRVEMNKGTFIC